MNSRFLLILLSLSFSGCSLIYSYSDNLPHRIDGWISDKKYNVALNTINHINPKHKDYRILQDKKKTIEKQMDAYENMAIEKSTLLTTQGDWIKAIELLDEVADNIANETKIKNHRSKVIKERQIIIASFEKDILYLQATNLINKIPLYEKIKKTVSDDESNQLNISKFNDLREETSLKLSIFSEQEYRNNEYNNSLNSINLALKLKPDADILARLNTTKQRIKEDTQKQKAQHIRKAKALLNKLSQGYSQEILGETKETIAWLNKESKKTYSILIQNLSKHLTKGVTQRFEAARNLYSKGKTQEALSIWVKLKELDPHNIQLQSHIERAEKVLNKLEKLSNKPKK